MKILFLVLLAFVPGCDRQVQLSPGQILQLERDCEVLAPTVRVPMKTELHLPIEALPLSFAALQPKAVSVNEEGIYIRLESKFVTESGFFYLRHNAVLSPSGATDPAFERIGTRLYRYRIKG